MSTNIASMEPAQGCKEDHRLQRAMLSVMSAKFLAFPYKRLTASQRRQVKALLEPGDILLESNYAFLLPQIGNRLFFGSNWIHAAIYVGDGLVVDSGRKLFVAELPLDAFLATTGLAIFRPNYRTSDDVSSMIAYAKAAVGSPFNVAFDQADTHSLYCAQLVANALMSMPNPIVLEPAVVFAKKVIPAAAVERSNAIKCVWSSHPRFLTNVGAHWPSLAASMVGSSWGHFVGLSSLAGGIIGIVALALLANSYKWNRHDQGLFD